MLGFVEEACQGCGFFLAGVLGGLNTGVKAMRVGLCRTMWAMQMSGF
jgi:hypothetical protein